MELLKEEFSLKGDFEVSKVHDKARVFFFLTTDQGACSQLLLQLWPTGYHDFCQCDNRPETVSKPPTKCFLL